MSPCTIQRKEASCATFLFGSVGLGANPLSQAGRPTTLLNALAHVSSVAAHLVRAVRIGADWHFQIQSLVLPIGALPVVVNNTTMWTRQPAQPHEAQHVLFKTSTCMRILILVAGVAGGWSVEHKGDSTPGAKLPMNHPQSPPRPASARVDVSGARKGGRLSIQRRVPL